MQERENVVQFEQPKSREEIIKSFHVTDVLATFSNLDEKWRADKEVAMAAVRIDGLALRFASDELKDDVQVVFPAYLNDENALALASKRMQDDRDRLKWLREERLAQGHVQAVKEAREQVEKEKKPKTDFPKAA